MPLATPETRIAMSDRVRAGGSVVELVATRTFRTADRPVPDLGPGEALVAPRAVGLCGTDLHAWRGRTDKLPIILTHDGIAEVIAVGPGVDHALIGSRVVIDPVDSCGSCEVCGRGRIGVCSDGGYLGLTVDGLLAERVALPATRLVRLPAEVDDISATVLEPVAIGCRIASWASHREVVPRRALIVGGGPLGMLVGVVLGSRGWDVHIVEPQTRRRDVIERLGLCALEPGEAPGFGRAELVVETSATVDGTALAVEAVAPGSALVVLGRSLGGIGSDQILLRELTVVGLRGAPGWYPEAVRAVAEGSVSPAAVVSDVFESAQVQAAFEAYDRSDPPLRAVLRR